MNYLVAAQIVCQHAKSADDARLLLTMLGLYEDGVIVEPKSDSMELSNPKHLPIGTKLRKRGKPA